MPDSLGRPHGVRRAPSLRGCGSSQGPGPARPVVALVVALVVRPLLPGRTPRPLSDRGVIPWCPVLRRRLTSWDRFFKSVQTHT